MNCIRTVDEFSEISIPLLIDGFPSTGDHEERLQTIASWGGKWQDLLGKTRHPTNWLIWPTEMSVIWSLYSEFWLIARVKTRRPAKCPAFYFPIFHFPCGIFQRYNSIGQVEIVGGATPWSHLSGMSIGAVSVFHQTVITDKQLKWSLLIGKCNIM